MKYDLYNDNLLEKVKTASYEELDELCSDIRAFLVDSISETGGHLASNLGVVELTVALHRVYDSPKDKIIYDVGHQSYVHKILTGRASDFGTLRQYKGLSGFPKRRESEHDIYETGHSSTSISAAWGLAVAINLNKEDGEVIAVIGDGSMTGGIVFEALNNIGASGTKVRIILNDNGMSISTNVGSMSRHLTSLRTSNRYLNAKSQINSALGTVPLVGDKLKAGISQAKERIKHSIITDEAALFEDLGITYIGPVDGHNLGELTAALEASNKINGPTIVHAITTKGKGYGPAEDNPSKFHGISSFDKDSGMTAGAKGGDESYSTVFGKTLVDIAADNKSVAAITAAMGDATGLGPFSELYPKRFFDVGIAEQHAVTFAAGLAANGLTPVVAIYSSFLQRAFDFIIEDVCLQNHHVVFAIDRAGLVGADGETHHGMFDLSYLGMIPGITIYAPAGARQLKQMLEHAVNEMDSPVAIRYPRGTSRIEAAELLPDFDVSNPVIHTGRDVTILAVGAMLDTGLEVRNTLTELGYDAGLVHVCVVKPLSEDLGKLDTRLVVIIEDNTVCGGFGAAFAAANKAEKYDIYHVGIPDEFIEHGSVSELRKQCGLDADGIVKGVKERFEGKA